MFYTIWDAVVQGNIQKVFQAITKQGYTINDQTGFYQLTPLQLAIACQPRHFVVKILELGGDPLVRNKDGQDAIDIAK